MVGCVYGTDTISGCEPGDVCTERNFSKSVVVLESDGKERRYVTTAVAKKSKRVCQYGEQTQLSGEPRDTRQGTFSAIEYPQCAPLA